MLEAQCLTKRYSSVAAVSEVSFRVAPHHILGYLGPNGSGKSTTVKMLTGLLRPSEGRVMFRGEDIGKNLAEYKRHLGYVPEEANLYPYLSGREYLELIGELRGLDSTWLGRRIDDYLQLFSLHGSRHLAIGTYSKGMRQRILITAALLHNPDVLVFDEPLSGLDITSTLVFRHLVQELGRRGKSIFYCSHVLEVVEKICSHVLILRKGSMVEYGSMAELRERQSMQSLEQTFSRLVDESDTMRTAREMADLTLEAR
jgi:ABC-2 type transport system ATP-binding protein